MRHELIIVFARTLKTQKHDKGLLEPVTSLQQVIQLELGPHLPVGVLVPKMIQVVPPAILERHDVHTHSAHDTPIR